MHMVRADVRRPQGPVADATDLADAAEDHIPSLTLGVLCWSFHTDTKVGVQVSTRGTAYAPSARGNASVTQSTQDDIDP